MVLEITASFKFEGGGGLCPPSLKLGGAQAPPAPPMSKPLYLFHHDKKYSEKASDYKSIEFNIYKFVLAV